MRRAGPSRGPVEGESLRTGKSCKAMRPTFEEQGNPDLTDLPAFNEFSAEIQRFLEGRTDLARARELLARLDQMLGRMFASFLDELQFREETDIYRERVPQVSEAFDWLRRLVPALQEAVDRGDPGTIREVLEDARDAVQSACRGLTALDAEDEAHERFSESWPVHELCRVGRAWLRGRLPQQSFRLRLESFEAYHRTLQEGLIALEPQAHEQVALESRFPSVLAALERQEAALECLQAALEEDDEEPILPALEEIQQATVDLVGVQRALQDAIPREEERPCPRCGVVNPTSARFCGGCRGTLPRLVWELEPESPRLDVVDEAAEGPSQYPHLDRLAHLVEDFRAGHVDEAELVAFLGRLEALLSSTWSQLTHLEGLPAEAPAHLHQTIRSARRALEEGHRRLAEGLRDLRQGLRDLAGPGLERGLEKAWSAAGPMAEFERLYREACGT